jgi:hypothetical protein
MNVDTVEEGGMSIDRADEDMGIPDDLIVGGREKERCRGIVYFRLLACSAEGLLDMGFEIGSGCVVLIGDAKLFGCKNRQGFSVGSVCVSYGKCAGNVSLACRAKLCSGEFENMQTSLQLSWTS